MIFLGRGLKNHRDVYKRQPDGILVPRQYWQSTARYDEAAHNLAVMFEENFEKKYSHLSLIHI